jgi:arabinose-5-phosphate isomerase
MADALLEISRKGFGVVGVLDDAGALVGIVTDGDLRRHMQGLLDLTAAEVMTKDPRTITPDALAEEAVALMNARKITCVFVLDESQGAAPLGLVHIHDCLRVGLG